MRQYSYLYVLCILLNGCTIYLEEEVKPQIVDEQYSGDIGGSDTLLNLPFSLLETHQCVQGANGSFSHAQSSTMYDLDFDTSNFAQEEIYAPVSGLVSVHYSSANFGYHLNIDLGDGSYVCVAHLDTVAVLDGAEVSEGQLIGYEGCTGYCTGDHVHIGLHSGDATLPAQYGVSIPAIYRVRDVSANGQLVTIESEQVVCGLGASYSEPDGHLYSSDIEIPLWHPNGSLVKTMDDAKVYLIDDGAARWITNESIFFSYSYDFSDITLISDEELACYEGGEALNELSGVDAAYDASTGLLWMQVGHLNQPDRYRIRVHNQIGWEAVLESWGLSYSAVNPPPTYSSGDNFFVQWSVASGYAKFRDGSLITEVSSSDVYFITDGWAVPIFDWDTFVFAGLALRDIVVAENGAVEWVQEYVGDCFVGMNCLEKDVMTVCGGDLDLESVDLGDDDDDTVSDDDDSMSDDDDSESDDDDSVELPIDNDGDGWPDTVDCNDSAASINPAASEVCGNDFDEDCSGEADECEPESDDTTPTLVDNDGDGFASEESGGTDCSDFVSSIYPGAVDICGDGVDQDCSGTDEPCPSSTIDTDSDGVLDSVDNCPFHNNPTQADVDGDGLGNDCDTDNDNDGYPNNQDCAAYDASINPGAVEACDGIDNDCDWLIDEDSACNATSSNPCAGELVCTEDLDNDGLNEQFCFDVSVFTQGVVYQTSSAYAVGYGLFDWMPSSSDEALVVGGYHCLDFSNKPAGNAEITLVSSVGSSGASPVDLNDPSDWVWWQNFSFCTSGVTAADEFCSFQGGWNYLVSADWDPLIGLTPAGDNASP